MASALTWLEILAGFRALYDLAKSGSDYSASYSKHFRAVETLQEARRVSHMFTTASVEIQALLKNIEECRDRLISLDSEKDRSRCLCTFFNEIKAGNGGSLPLIDDWQLTYDELGCSSQV